MVASLGIHCFWGESKKIPTCYLFVLKNSLEHKSYSKETELILNSIHQSMSSISVFHFQPDNLLLIKKIQIETRILFIPEIFWKDQHIQYIK